MTIQIPTTAESAQKNLSNIEAKINQTVPANDKSFARVDASVLAGVETSLYKYAVERIQQVLALTATGEDLEALATQYGLTVKAVVAAVLTATTASTSMIPATLDYVGDGNAIRYNFPVDTVPVADVATLTLTAQTAGAIGNLSVTDTLSIGSPNPGTETTATVTAIVTTGADAETDDELRVRLLDKIRGPGGGGNAADYRNWSQETPGVLRTYPTTGDPWDDASADIPPERTVYVESTTAINTDGIPPGSLLDDVRDYITTNQETGKSRQPLGLTDATLYVEPIRRTGFYVEVRGLVVDSALEAQTKANIESAVTVYFAALRPYIDGLDPTDDAVKSKITDATITVIVQNVVAAAGATITGIGFGIAPGLFVGSYFLGQGELGKLTAGGVTYA